MWEEIWLSKKVHQMQKFYSLRRRAVTCPHACCFMSKLTTSWSLVMVSPVINTLPSSVTPLRPPRARGRGVVMIHSAVPAMFISHEDKMLAPSSQPPHTRFTWTMMTWYSLILCDTNLLILLVGELSTPMLLSASVEVVQVLQPPIDIVPGDWNMRDGPAPGQEEGLTLINDAGGAETWWSWHWWERWVSLAAVLQVKSPLTDSSVQHHLSAPLTVPAPHQHQPLVTPPAGVTIPPVSQLSTRAPLSITQSETCLAGCSLPASTDHVTILEKQCEACDHVWGIGGLKFQTLWPLDTDLSVAISVAG